jgi:hypothetical protein
MLEERIDKMKELRKKLKEEGFDLDIPEDEVESAMKFNWKQIEK